MKKEWGNVAKDIVNSFDENQLDRFNRLDDYVRYLFYNGYLNPTLINYAIKQPTYFVQTFNMDNNQVKQFINKMANCLNKIRKIATQINFNLIIVSVPYGIYVSNYSYIKHQELGFLLVSDMLTSNSPDKAIEMASKTAGLKLLTVTEEIRQKCKQSNLYYDLDGHFNVQGNKDYADSLTTLFKTYLLKIFLN